MIPTEQKLEILNERAIRAINKNFLWEDEKDFVHRHENIDQQVSRMVPDERDEYNRVLKRALEYFNLDNTIPDPWVKTLALVHLYDPGRIDGIFEKYFKSQDSI